MGTLRAYRAQMRPMLTNNPLVTGQFNFTESTAHLIVTREQNCLPFLPQTLQNTSTARSKQPPSFSIAWLNRLR